MNSLAEPRRRREAGEGGCIVSERLLRDYDRDQLLDHARASVSGPYIGPHRPARSPDWVAVAVWSFSLAWSGWLVYQVVRAVLP